MLGKSVIGVSWGLLEPEYGSLTGLTAARVGLEKYTQLERSICQLIRRSLESSSV